MAYLRKQRLGKQEYLYVMESRRRGDKVRQVCLEYLGNARTLTPARLREAMRYWRVGQKRKGKGRKGRRAKP
jgi:hypothetical protein